MIITNLELEHVGGKKKSHSQKQRSRSKVERRITHVELCRKRAEEREPQMNRKPAGKES